MSKEASVHNGIPFQRASNFQELVSLLASAEPLLTWCLIIATDQYQSCSGSRNPWCGYLYADRISYQPITEFQKALCSQPKLHVMINADHPKHHRWFRLRPAKSYPGNRGELQLYHKLLKCLLWIYCCFYWKLLVIKRFQRKYRIHHLNDLISDHRYRYRSSMHYHPELRM